VPSRRIRIALIVGSTWVVVRAPPGHSTCTSEGTSGAQARTTVLASQDQ